MNYKPLVKLKIRRNIWSEIITKRAECSAMKVLVCIVRNLSYKSQRAKSNDAWCNAIMVKQEKEPTPEKIKFENWKSLQCKLLWNHISLEWKAQQEFLFVTLLHTVLFSGIKTWKVTYRLDWPTGLGATSPMPTMASHQV